MNAFNIEKIVFNSKCGIKEEEVRNIIEDRFPKSDYISFQDVSDNIRDDLKKLGYYFNVYVANHASDWVHLNCGISIVYNSLIKYKVKYGGKYKYKSANGDRDTTGDIFIVKIWN